MAELLRPRGADVLRPRGFDDLGLRRALGDRTLPLLVGAMTFLAALAVAGALATSGVAAHWREGAGAALTVQVPRPADPAEGGAPRIARVAAILGETAGVAAARALPEAELNELLRPWLGRGAEDSTLPLPGVVAVRLDAAGLDDAAFQALAARVAQAAPGARVEAHRPWLRRLSLLARTLEACAWAALALVTAVAVAVIAVATGGGLARRREAIETVHGLGATDGYIAGRFARRAAGLAGLGAALGAALALPVLLGLARLAAPFAPPAEGDAAGLGGPPPAVWLGLLGLPAAAALIGYATAQGTVRRWLRRLP